MELSSKELSPKVQATLKSLGVAVVYCFGSQAQGALDPQRDLDLGIVLKDPKRLQHSLEIYSRLYDLFTDCFPQFNRIDIVFLQQASPGFQFQVIRTGHVLFVEDPTFQADYEEGVVRTYLDFEPLLREHRQALLER